MGLVGALEETEHKLTHLGNITPGTTLSDREIEVLLLLSKGCSNKEIARLLTVSLHTINDHTKRILRRLDVNTRVEAAVWAAKAGML